MKEAFLDADNFELSIHQKDLSEAGKKVLLAAVIFIDLVYFDSPARS